MVCKHKAESANKPFCQTQHPIVHVTMHLSLNSDKDGVEALLAVKFSDTVHWLLKMWGTADSKIP